MLGMLLYLSLYNHVSETGFWPNILTDMRKAIITLGVELHLKNQLRTACPVCTCYAA